MPEQVQWWWERRQRSKGAATPYSLGQFRADWERYPVLVRQYHPDLNHGIALTQVPPAADVWLLWQCEVGHTFVATPWEQRQRPGRSRRRSTWCPECTVDATGRPPRAEKPRARPLCSSSIATRFAVGEPFSSECAPRRASAVEGDLHQRLADRLEFTPGMNAVRVKQPFFEHLEVWPDILVPELRVALEYDTIGRFGLEHVGRREDADRRKDRTLRAVGWEVVRLRVRPLEPIGPHDIRLTRVDARALDRVLAQLSGIRGAAAVDALLLG